MPVTGLLELAHVGEHKTYRYRSCHRASAAVLRWQAGDHPAVITFRSSVHLAEERGSVDIECDCNHQIRYPDFKGRPSKRTSKFTDSKPRISALPVATLSDRGQARNKTPVNLIGPIVASKLLAEVILAMPSLRVGARPLLRQVLVSIHPCRIPEQGIHHPD